MKLFGAKDPKREATRELREAQLALLQSDAAAEHYKHSSAMLRERIERLTKLAAVDKQAPFQREEISRVGSAEHIVRTA